MLHLTLPCVLYGRFHLKDARKEHYDFNGQNGIMSKTDKYPPIKLPKTSHYRNRRQLTK